MDTIVPGRRRPLQRRFDLCKLGLGVILSAPQTSQAVTLVRTSQREVARFGSSSPSTNGVLQTAANKKKR